MKTVVVMCPACGDIAFPDENEHSYDICDYCGTRRILTDGDGDMITTINIDEREVIIAKMYRKYLFTHPQFNEELYEARMKKNKDYMDAINKRIYERDHPSCPRCRSTAITAGQRGYNIITGFLGSNQTVNRCASCGHQWKP